MHINDSINSIHLRKSSVCFCLTFYLRGIHARLGLSTPFAANREPFYASGAKPPSAGCKCDRKYAIITRRAFRLTSRRIKSRRFPSASPSKTPLFLIYRDGSKQACDAEIGLGCLPRAISISHSKLAARTGHIIENCSWTVYNLVKGCLGN